MAKKKGGDLGSRSGAEVRMSHQAWLADQFERAMADLPPGCGYAGLVGYLLSAAKVPDARVNEIIEALIASSRLPFAPKGEGPS